MEILKKLGLTEAEVASLSEEGTDLESLVSKVRGKAVELHKNSPEYQDELTKAKGAEVGKFLGSMASKIKRAFPFLPHPVDALKEMDVNEIFEIVNKHHEKPGKGDEIISQLQDEKIDLLNQLNKIKDEEIPGIHKKYESEKTRAALGLKMAEKLATMKGSQTLIPEIAGAKTLLEAVLPNKYEFSVSESGIEIFVPGSEKKVKPTGKVDGIEKVLGFDDVISLELDSLGLIRKSNGKTDPERKEIDPKKLEGRSKQDLTNLEKARERLEQMKKL